MEYYKNKNIFEENEIVKISISEELKSGNEIYEELDNNLPEGYCVIGGAARSLLLGYLHDGIIPPVRDIDVAYFPDEADLDLHHEISEKYAPEDFEHGHGAQEIKDIDDYMWSRDITLNQVIYKNGELITTRRAIEDSRRSVIRPLENRIDHDWKGEYLKQEVSPRIALKSTLQKVVLSEYLPDIHIEGNLECPDLDLDGDDNHSIFQMALCIQKSFEYGEEVPQKFIDEVLHSELFSGDKYLIDYDGDEYSSISRDKIPYLIMVSLIGHADYPFYFTGEALRYFNRSKSAEEDNDQVYKYYPEEDESFTPIEGTICPDDDDDSIDEYIEHEYFNDFDDNMYYEKIEAFEKLLEKRDYKIA